MALLLPNGEDGILDVDSVVEGKSADFWELFSFVRAGEIKDMQRPGNATVSWEQLSHFEVGRGSVKGR